MSIKYATAQDARDTVAKVKKIRKPFARKIQILTVLEQRAKAAGKHTQADIAKRGKELYAGTKGKVMGSLNSGEINSGFIGTDGKIKGRVVHRKIRKTQIVAYQKLKHSH